MAIHYPNLNIIAQKRTGGAINIQGITYQFKYCCSKILQVTNDDTLITLEGIEDLDIIEKSISENLFIQLKYSKNLLTTSGLNKMNTFSNFLEVYLLDPNARFKIVTNQQFTDKNLCAVQNQNLSKQGLVFWEEYYKKLQTTEPKSAKWNWSNFNLIDFLEKIEFEIISESQLDTQCKKLIIDNHKILTDNQRLFISDIFYNIHAWSINKKTITFQEIKDSIQETREEIARGIENDAIKYRWIEPVNFINSSDADNSDYYQGKPAKPIHIALGLPARRKRIEEEIEKSIIENNITVLKASSGQGKSTLAWQVAFNLYQKEWTILELKVSEDLGKISHLVDYLKFKIRTDCTLLVLDGLSKITQNWSELAQNLSELPIKILITTREEDWTKYGSEIYKLSLSMPEIKLGFQEAEDIYKQFNRKGVIHIGSDGLRKPFQYYWEQIANKGLLIEYVYLITQGRMLESRLREQVRNIEKEENGGITKLETLRLVTLADVCNIKIEALQLNQFLQSKNLLKHTDKRTLYLQLEKEYSIRFENDYIEGLHPVRSLHLLNILHEGTPIIETVANLCQVVDSEDFFSLFSFFPSLISLQNQEKNFDYLINAIVGKPFTSLVKATEGLFAWEVNSYWQMNKQIFDEIYLKFGNSGGYAFTFALLPYQNEANLNNLTQYIGGLTQILNNASKAIKFDFTRTKFLIFFVTKLYKHFHRTSPSINTLDGLAGLLQWFDIFNLPLLNVIKVSNNELLSFFDRYQVENVASFLELYNVTKPDEYKCFLENYEEYIISTLKEKTDTPTLFVDGGELFAEYLYHSSCTKEVNELTNDRMNVFMKVLPFYTRYTVEGQFLHYPTEAITRTIKSNSRKSFTHKTLIIDDYKAYLNSIWHNEIDSRYQTNSEYEWQAYAIGLRKQCLLCVKMKVRLFEALIDDIPSRYMELAVEIEKINKLISTMSLSNKKRPFSKNMLTRTPKNSNLEKDIRDWEFSFITCFVAQFQTLLDLDLEKRRLAKLNLRSAVSRLSKMQIAFEEIKKETYSYFNSNELVEEETEWYDRLERSVLFYDEILQGKYRRQSSVAKDECFNWYQNRVQEELDNAIKLLAEIEEDTGMIFHYPKFIQKEEYIKLLTIGITIFNLQHIEQEVLILILGLTKLIKLDIHKFNIVILNVENLAVCAFSVSKNYLEKIHKFQLTQVFEDDELGLHMSPLPIPINSELIVPLEGVGIFNQSKQSVNEELNFIVEKLWLFTEYRNRLDLDSTIEKKWFDEIQKKYDNDIKNSIRKIQSSSLLENTKDQIQNLYKEVFNGINYNSTQFGEFLTRALLHNIFEINTFKIN
ncbi:P-loop NTPase [Flectobacillus longus]|uniref:P-loop NTPase n=1 Tax=Flectobacillus longus TaxID=2984207 RepID=UPI0024B65BF4|nr:hypothetical protein [Flectobacillus longus]MDI9878308.1 hypothetical protein [Flectobacillus longus]